jgi:hypothetical protein
MIVDDCDTNSNINNNNVNNIFLYFVYNFDLSYRFLQAYILQAFNIGNGNNNSILGSHFLQLSFLLWTSKQVW